MFIGRVSELKELKIYYQKPKSQLAVVYGRRRIGKSELLNFFAQDKKYLKFEGLEGEKTPTQIKNFLKEFSKQTKNPFYAKLKLTSWSEVLDLMTEYLENQNEKILIIFDEFQWMASGQTRLVKLLKHYWDNQWKNLNVMLILCGSVAHYMVKKVIHSKALYGRINLELVLKGLNPIDSKKMLKQRGPLESLKYLMVLGSVPKYLEEINQNNSFEQNINKLCFTENGFMVNELEKIFYSQFKEVKVYLKIVQMLSKQNLSLAEISKKLNIPSGGGLKSYLDNLEKASFIRGYTSFDQKGNRNLKYKLFDEYLNFYFKFINPLRQRIQENKDQKLFQNLVIPHWESWLGIAFEVFCLKNALFIAEKAGFSEEVISFGPYFKNYDAKFQIDLIYLRSHNIKTVCEIKFHSNPIETEIIPEVEKKIKLLKINKKETIEKMLIAPLGASESLLKSKYFHHVISLDDIF